MCKHLPEYSCFLFFSGEGTFGIVQPFPENIFPLEYTTASVTCIAFDASGVREPEEILFFRRDDLNIVTELKPSEKLSFSHRTEYLGEYTHVFVEFLPFIFFFLVYNTFILLSTYYFGVIFRP